MKLILAINTGLFVSSVALFLVIVAPQQVTFAEAEEAFRLITEQNQTETNEATAEAEAEDVEEEPEQEDASVVYEYVAQSGDSYTAMARKATQTYGLRQDVSLSPAQIIFVETNLTQAAGSPVLFLGEQVTIEESSMEEWIEQAQELSEAEEAEWEQYVPVVDFNTDAVGEKPLA